MSFTETSTVATEHHRALTAFFDTREAADKAKRDLIAAGIPADDIRVVGSGSATADTDDRGFWESLKDFFIPDEDRYSYAEGLRRGGFAVYVQTGDATIYQRASDILDNDGAVDLDEREASWRKEGWTGYQAGSTTTTGLGAVSTADTTLSTTRTTDTARTAAGVTGAAAATAVGVGRDEVIPVYEEQLRVGKRDTSGGRVRIRSYVVETPVNEEVTLRQERVQVERRPVDRAVTGGEALFQDRVIEATERFEEAVVEKSVRVKEEISIQKTAEDQRKTISDSVRRTEVEVEDDRNLQVAKTGVVSDYSTMIAEHMEVIASDGQKLGKVDHLQQDSIKLTKTDSADGQHHIVPLSWVDHVDTHVHLNKTAASARNSW